MYVGSVNEWCPICKDGVRDLKQLVTLSKYFEIAENPKIIFLEHHFQTIQLHFM